jgi:DNA modification methylase
VDAGVECQVVIRREEIIGDCRLLLGDCAEVLPTLGQVDAVLTDPPFGIKMAGGVRGGGYDGFGKGIKRQPKIYTGDWDASRPSADVFALILSASQQQIIWGGNYFSDLLPASQKWLFWDKLQTMPSYSDGELAWTNLSGTSLKKFTYAGAGLMAREKEREHPTQKPIELMRWCLGFLPDAMTVLDPFMGSGTTLVAAAKAGRPAVGIEIDPDYFDIACRRVEAAYRQPDLFIDRPAPLVQTGMDL